MATTTTCDVCPTEPRQPNDADRATPATWVVAAKTQDGSVVNTAKAIDVCDRHVAAAVDRLMANYGKASSFLRIEAMRLA